MLYVVCIYECEYYVCRYIRARYVPHVREYRLLREKEH